MILATSYLAHPLHGLGYQFFSGIGSSISEWLTVAAAIGVYLYHHNCHTHRCWRISTRVLPDGKETHSCKKHDPRHPSEGIIRNVFKRLGLRPATPGAEFHYTKKHTREAAEMKKRARWGVSA